jgi:hypothetical protein
VLTVCVQVVGRVRGPSISTAAAAQLATAAAAAAAEAEGVISSGSAATPSSGATGAAAAAAAAAMLASPRHGLHSPRTRVSEQQVELAVVGTGDILGESHLLSLTGTSTPREIVSLHDSNRLGLA